jgi:glutamine phosphoribosylpyrophosphate amidotransferase
MAFDFVIPVAKKFWPLPPQVHNGTIENSSELRAELEAKGIVFKSQTDTEVIVQLIGSYLDQVYIGAVVFCFIFCCDGVCLRVFHFWLLCN